MTPPRREEGAALLAVLLLVAVLGALAAVALDRVGLATRLAANGAAADQARAYAIGAEALAVTQVARLTDRRLDRTTAAGGWLDRAYRFPVPGGLITALLADGGNCFNLNSVVAGVVPTASAARPVGMTQFAGLMESLGVPRAQATGIAAATADWIDADTTPLPGGAEDDAYAQAATPYRTANSFMLDPTELRGVAGMTPAIYATIAPYLCTLPSAELSPLNVNTLAAAQAPLVAMLMPGVLTVQTAAAIIAARPPQGWSDTSQFWKGPALAGLTPLAEVQAQPQVRTRYVRAVLDVAVGDAEVRETALIDGAATPPRVLSRAWGDGE